MNSQKEGEKMKKFKFQYFDSMTFLAYLALTIIGIFVGCTAPGFLGLYAMTTILGILLMQIGDSIPLFYKYVGGGAFIAIFGSALIRYLNIFPEDLTASIDNFVKKEKNNAGLQVADFVPNAFAREHAGFGQLDADTTLINKMKYFRYRGVDGNQDRYGVKYMP